MRIYAHAYTYAYIDCSNAWTHVYTYMHVYIYIYTYAHICKRIYICIYTRCLNVWTQARTAKSPRKSSANTTGCTEQIFERPTNSRSRITCGGGLYMMRCVASLLSDLSGEFVSYVHVGCICRIYHVGGYSILLCGASSLSDLPGE